MTDLIWPPLPRFAAPWRDLGAAEAGALWRRMGGPFRDKINSFETNPVPQAARVMVPDFYPAHALLEIAFTERFDRGVRVWSAVVPRACLNGGTEIVDPYAITPLRGEAPLIHELNHQHFNFDVSPTSLIDYVRFFCGFIWGEQGAFYIIDGPADVPLARGAAPDAVQTALNGTSLSPPKLGDPDEAGVLPITANVLYADVLFDAKFTLQPSGMVDMEDDDQIAEDLPRAAERRDGAFRLFDSQRGWDSG